jgi:hypothetical protein
MAGCRRKLLLYWNEHHYTMYTYYVLIDLYSEKLDECTCLAGGDAYACETRLFLNHHHGTLLLLARSSSSNTLQARRYDSRTTIFSPEGWSFVLLKSIPILTGY